MTLHEGLRAQLLVDTGTGAFLAGETDADARVYPLVIPQKVPRGRAQVPAVVYTYVASAWQGTYCGVSRLVSADVRLDCYARTYHEARDLAAAVRSLLHDFAGSMGGTVDVRTAILTTEFDVQDFEPGLFRVSQSWTFWYTE